MQNVKEILSKLKRLAEESTYEGEKLAAQKAYDRISEKYKNEEQIDGWLLTNNEVALLIRYDMSVKEESDGICIINVPRDNAAAMDIALSSALKSVLRKHKKKSSKESEDIKCLTGMPSEKSV